MTGVAVTALLVAHGDVVTMNPAREVLVGGAVLVDDGVIQAVGSTSELRRTHPRRGGARRQPAASSRRG